MAFLRPTFIEEASAFIRGDGLSLRPPAMADFEAWAHVRRISRDQLVPFEPQWASDELSRSAFRERVRLYQRNRRDGTGYAFFIFRDADRSLIGALTFSNVRRGITQAASLGYWMGQPYTRQGNMQRALSAVLPFAFEDLRLHRLEAACLQHNLASQRVLEANSFVREGLARRYLRINGIWQDHVLFALIEEDWAA
jgi:[ribosomal protein S5]-alanine N-acetyltransferase